MGWKCFKARILQAVQEAKGAEVADRIAHLKKPEMATEAETLLAATGWLPEPLRIPGQVMLPLSAVTCEIIDGVSSTADESAEVETAAIGGLPAMDDTDQPGDDEDVEQDSQLTAAE